MDQSLAHDSNSTRDRLSHLLSYLEIGLIERRRAVRLTLLAALAGEHSLLIGPPGTAKSELARRLHTVFANARYFERLLTRFSVPEELFGPLSIKALEEDRYERHTAGFLPDASIAFIDEVFKANSAILNALLTLLNEREFDNGAGREQCPLISVVGASNEVPEDEVAEAFFDRFLLRVPVEPVSRDGFAQLLDTAHKADWTAPPAALRLDADALTALTRQAAAVTLPHAASTILAELREHLASLQACVSDRRWVKTVWLLRMAAACEGRTAVALWDLLLLPWCTAPDAARQAAVGTWLQTRIGVNARFSPPRLTRVVEAFEAQLDTELKANDLDYDASGRLRFSATELADEVGDAKGGAGALRMRYSRQRRYGARHIAARTAQIDDLIRRIAGYAEELAAQRQNLALYRSTSLWLESELADRVDANLTAVAEALSGLHQRAAATREGFTRLPRLPEGEDHGTAPEPVAVPLQHDA